MADIEVPGTQTKIPVAVLVIGGIGAFVLAMITRKQSAQSSAQPQVDTQALLTSELTQQMQEGFQSLMEWIRYQMGLKQGTVPVEPPVGSEPRPDTWIEGGAVPPGKPPENPLPPNPLPPMPLPPDEMWRPGKPWTPGIPSKPLPPTFPISSGGGNSNSLDNVISGLNGTTIITYTDSMKFPGYKTVENAPNYAYPTPATSGSSKVALVTDSGVKGVLL